MMMYFVLIMLGLILIAVTNCMTGITEINTTLKDIQKDINKEGRI